MRKSSIAVSLLLMTATVSAGPVLHIDVFYGANQYVVNQKQGHNIATVEVFDLTLPSQLEESLSKNLPSDPKKAQKEAQRRVIAGGHKLQRALGTAYAGTLRAAEYRIAKLPAVVFNYGDDVIYGVNDVSHAIKLYREKKR